MFTIFGHVCIGIFLIGLAFLFASEWPRRRS